jgi:tol-pal system beta propeller repeat protein TolB
MSKLHHSSGELYIMDVDGSNIRRLTHDDWHENNPALSPDRKKIAFHRAKNKQEYLTYEIFVLDLESGEEIRLTNNDVLDGHPDWSPDGKKIVYASFQTSEGNPFNRADIYLVNLDGTGYTQLTSSIWEDNDPEFSPDGTKIAFKSTRDTKQDGKEQIYIMDSDGSNVRRLTFNNGSDHDPSWSPDSKNIVFMRYEGPNFWHNMEISLLNPWNIYKVDLDNIETKLTEHQSICWLPVFSYNGEEILFFKMDPIINNEVITGYYNRLTIMNADGSNQQFLILDNNHTKTMQNFDW